MDPNVHEEDGQDVNNEPGQGQVARLITNPLSNPDTLRPILKHFSNNELLKLSLVNQLWKSEARWVLKSRGNLIATTQESNTCEDLEDFAMDLQFMPTFAGLNIKLGGQHACECSLASHAAILQGLPAPANKLELECEEILYGINWRVLAVQFDPGWNEHPACPGFLLLKSILDKFSSVLQEFSLRVEAYHNYFLQAVLQDHTFPNLKTLKFQDFGDYTKSNKYTNFIKELVSRAPTLQNLYTRGRVNLRANLREGSMALHVTDYPYSPSLDEIPENAFTLLRLERMTLVDISANVFVRGFNVVTPGVLNKSRNNLNWMTLDAPFLVPLMSYDVSLKNVRTLKINFDYSREFSSAKVGVWNCLESFDFNRMFPNLCTVQIHGDWKCTERLQRVLKKFAGIVDEERGKPVRDDRAVNIKNLELEWNLVLSRDYVQTFAKMFPNLRRLSIRADGIVPFDDAIYGSWPDLEELGISILGVNICLNLNLDADFCGIFPEEVAHLRQQDDEYLERVNIVPVKPSIPSLKSLKTLRISLEWESRLVLEPSELTSELGCPNSLFSKVTPLVAFKKCSYVTLTLVADDERVRKVLTHLQPYMPADLDFLG